MGIERLSPIIYMEMLGVHAKCHRYARSIRLFDSGLNLIRSRKITNNKIYWTFKKVFKKVYENFERIFQACLVIIEIYLNFVVEIPDEVICVLI